MRFKQHVLLKHDHGITAQWISDDWSWMAVATYQQNEIKARNIDGEWKILHYALTMLVPNEIAAEVGAQTQEADKQ